MKGSRKGGERHITRHRLGRSWGPCWRNPAGLWTLHKDSQGNKHTTLLLFPIRTCWSTPWTRSHQSTEPTDSDIGQPPMSQCRGSEVGSVELIKKRVSTNSLLGSTPHSSSLTTLSPVCYVPTNLAFFWFLKLVWLVLASRPLHLLPLPKVLSP